MLRLTRAALRECHAAEDFKNAQVLMKVSGMYVTGTSNHSQTNNKNNNNNNETNTKKTNNKNREDGNPSSNISLLDVLLAPSDTMKRLGMGNTCNENGNVASNKNNNSNNNDNNDNNICRILIDAAKDALEGKKIKRRERVQSRIWKAL